MIECGKRIQKGWKFLADKHQLNIKVGSIYPLSHFDFLESPLILKTLFTQEMLSLGFLATTSYYACYAHRNEHIDQYLNAVDIVFGFIFRALKEGNPEEYLHGPVCQTGFKRLS